MKLTVSKAVIAASLNVSVNITNTLNQLKQVKESSGKIKTVLKEDLLALLVSNTTDPTFKIVVNEDDVEFEFNDDLLIELMGAHENFVNVLLNAAIPVFIAANVMNATIDSISQKYYAPAADLPA